MEGFFCTVTEDQVIYTLVSVVVILAGSIVTVAKMGWSWFGGQFDYLKDRIEHLEKKIDLERDDQESRLDNIIEKVLSKLETSRISKTEKVERKKA